MRLWEESGRGSGCGEDGRGRTRSVFCLGMSISCRPVQAPVARAGSSGPCRLQWPVQAPVARAGSSGPCRLQWLVQAPVARAGSSGPCRLQWPVLLPTVAGLCSCNHAVKGTAAVL